MQTLTFHNITLTPAKLDNQIWLSSSDLAKALGYASDKSVTNLYNSNSDEFISSMTALIPNPQMKNAKIRIFSLRGCHLIAMFARTATAKAFRQWVLDILDKEVGEPTTNPLSTTAERKGLVMAVNRLAQQYGYTYPTAWKLVHEYMNVESADQLTTSQIPTAIAYVHSLMMQADPKLYQTLTAIPT
ncbi:Bro-N domain-containing protein [Moraxella sp. ZJ142]|uniref:BRO-N domain-containing protein n=1 Tax=Moraxella marmotae TaxID=3344520 RepID=UPI0035D50E04